MATAKKVKNIEEPKAAPKKSEIEERLEALEAEVSKLNDLANALKSQFGL